MLMPGQHPRANISAYLWQVFQACDSYNQQIKSRMWPHKHGGRGHLGERGKHSSFAFACVLQNTFNAYRSIMKMTKSDFEYYSFCETLANDLYQYAHTQSAATIA